jgi:hypothetical protein
MYTLAGFEPGIFSSVGDDLYATPAGHSIFSSFKKATTKTSSSTSFSTARILAEIF